MYSETFSGQHFAKCTKSSLGNGTSSTITVVASNPGNGSAEAVLQVSSYSPDQSPSNNSATVSVP